MNIKIKRIIIKREIRKIGAKCILLIATFSVIILNLCGYSKISEMKYDIYYLQKDLRKRDSIRGTKGKRN